jgi:hypothetical protein
VCDRRPSPDHPTPPSQTAARALLERIADAVELAIDADDWRVCVDILLDLADLLRREKNVAVRP